MGGRLNPTETNAIEFMSMSSAGKAKDFGDLTQGRQMRSGACSNGHGGL